MALQVYTASLLKEGLVAYLCLEDGLPSWTPEIGQATAMDDGSVESLKIAAEKSERDNIIVAPYAIDVVNSDGGWVAATKREQIRASGPTIVLPRDNAANASERAGRKAA
ncbi:DUF2849 domain-containing protein [Sneathiella marina]|uniref:DUF2849 domain-containing protein n=1 Tax=Sneathiella marina TaxID=2950108 RepID=A0ABY4W0W2_9PROT|nr:DUF2849 domain-containing protein [Sneathiella marina]USG60723.1 DUF2849 domain-containing protein [Sneathiella marina]